MKRLLKFLGSLRIAVPLIIAIAMVLAWGTIYEAQFGTAAVQRFIYRSWWFQSLLAFLALNLAIAAWQRYPWKRHHTPFVLAHLGIILILTGGVLGSRFGIDGQMIIPEGQAEQMLETPGNVIVIHQPNPGVHQILPTRFESQAWVHEPKTIFTVPLSGRTLQLTVDRYYPDAVTAETITGDGREDNPAVHVLLSHNEQQEVLWLLAKDPERFGMGWGDAHVLFLEPESEAQLTQLLAPGRKNAPSRGAIAIKVPGLQQPRELPVPEARDRTVEIDGTPYRITFKDYFPDFAITEDGVTSRSNEPNNPAVSFTLSGPEGTDAYLLFALHPEFQSMHGFKHVIPAEVSYTHTAAAALPPKAIAILRLPSGALAAVLTDGGQERQVITPLALNQEYTHPSLGYAFRVVAYEPRARVNQEVSNRSNEIHAEAIHVIGAEGAQRDEAWVFLREKAELHLGKEPLIVEYRPDQRKLPVTIKLLDFRKITYPGTQIASGFEAQVEMSDPERGVILMKKISMNNPLRYRGYHFYQSSYIEGPTQTTVLSVRNDPGTPFVYAGFSIVIVGVISLFRRKAPVISGGARRNRQ